MQETSEPIAIIGAGITGLTTAFNLAQQGRSVVVYEASDRPGGVIKTTLHEGFLAESGPNSILDTSPRLQEFIRDIGLADQRLDASPTAKTRYIVRDKKPVALPASPPALFTSKAFSARAKLRLMREPFISSKSNETESLADFVLRRLGQEFLDYAINPFVSGVYAGDPAKLSTKQAFPKLYQLEQEYGSLIKGALLGAKKRKQRKEVSKKDARMFTFKKGMEEFPRQLASLLGDRLQLNHPVITIEPSSDGGWLVNGNKHASVVLAMPAHRYQELETPFDLSLFSEIYYPPVVSLSMGFRTEQISHPLDGFGMLIPRVEGFYSLGTLFTSSIFPDRAPAGAAMLTTFIGGAIHPERANKEPNSIIRHVLQDHFNLLGLRGDPCYTFFNPYPFAIPQYNLGYERFLNQMDHLEKAYPGLYFAGNSRDGISVADSILSGLNMADRILKE
jgi:protoporphyrinogen/coproporphyrinogen III oxidase